MFQERLSVDEYSLPFQPGYIAYVRMYVSNIHFLLALC